MNRLIFVLIFGLLVSFKLKPQDYEWWNEIHNWDGISKWEDYIIKSPGFLGPNALPVPRVTNGTVPENLEFQIATDFHFSKGDKTQNIFLWINYPVVKNIISMEFYVVPFEHYKMTEEMRDLRFSRDYDGEGISGGDIYFATLIQILKEKDRWPDIALRLTCKTASSENLGGARFTDSPGYFFDLSFGKKISPGIKLSGMAGFYVWQIDYYNGLITHRQDDAFLFGISAENTIKNLSVSNTIAGYLGYIDIKDKPIVYRLDLKKKFGKIDVHAGYQYGINDVKYHMFRVSVFFSFEKGIIEFPL